MQMFSSPSIQAKDLKHHPNACSKWQEGCHHHQGPTGHWMTEFMFRIPRFVKQNINQLKVQCRKKCVDGIVE